MVRSNTGALQTRLRSLREVYGYTQSDCESLLGWKPGWWGRVENGLTRTGADAVVAMFQVDSTWLMPRECGPVFAKRPSSVTLARWTEELATVGWLKSDVAEVAGITEEKLAQYIDSVRPGRPRGILLQGDILERLMNKAPDGICTLKDDEFIPSQSALRHLRELSAIGLMSGDRGDGPISHLTGIPGRSIQKFMGRPESGPYIQAWASNAILAISADVDSHPPSELGARRRIEALAAWGYHPDDIASRVGINELAMKRIMESESNAICIDRKIGTKLVELFAKLEHIPGESDVAKEMAKNNDWCLPFQWDSDTIDKPAAKKYIRSRRKIGALFIDPQYRDMVVNKELNELIESMKDVA